MGILSVMFQFCILITRTHHLVNTNSAVLASIFCSSMPTFYLHVICIYHKQFSQWQVQRLAACWAVRGSKPGGGEIFRTRPDRP